MNLDARLFRDFCRFAQGQLDSGDIDPMYPALRAVYAAERVPEHLALWRTALYVTCYHAGTAERLWRVAPEPGSLPPYEQLGFRFVTGVERRAFRGLAGYDLARGHVEALLRRSGGDLQRWVRNTIAPGGEEGWRRMRAEWAELPYGGPWSSYKFSDLLAHVHGLPITANDIGVGGGGETAGPIPGMVALTGEDWRRCASDVDLQKRLLATSLDAGVTFSGLDQMETALCDFNSLRKGRYYVGHDIDGQMEQFQSGGVGATWWEARGASFPNRYLGEAQLPMCGWFGVRADLKTLYARKGEVRL
jgi:hypothetical protein